MEGRGDTLLCMGTTGELSKAGGIDGATVDQSMKSSREYMRSPSKAQGSCPFTQSILRANSTLQMHPHEVYTFQNPFSFHQYNFQQSSTTSLSTHNHPSPPPNGKLAEKRTTPKKLQNGLTTLVKGLILVHNNVVEISVNNQMNPIHNPLPKFDQPIPMSKVTQAGTHKAYHTGIVPVPSTLCPNCLAWDRLWLWYPLSSQSGNTGCIKVSKSDLDYHIHFKLCRVICRRNSGELCLHNMHMAYSSWCSLGHGSYASQSSTSRCGNSSTSNIQADQESLSHSEADGMNY